jgi:hypothetical protein
MIPQSFSAYNSNGYPRPDDFVDPQYKQGKPTWCHLYIQFIFSQYMNGSSAITSAMRQDMDTNLKYAEGNQDTAQYKTRFLDEANSSQPSVPNQGNDLDSSQTNKGKNEGYANIDFNEVFSPIPQYLRKIIGLMQNQEHDIKIGAIDEHSGSLREEIKYMLYSKKELFDEIQLFNKAFGLDDMTKDVPLPQSIEELEMFSQMGMFKLPYEIGMKKANNHTDDLSKLRLLKDDLIYDFAVQGMAATETFVDTNGYVKHDHIDLFDLIIENSKKKDHSDASYGARIKWLTAADLKEETGWEDNKIRALISKFAGTYGNPSYDPNKTDERSFSMTSYRIPVLRAYWKSVDSFFNTQRNKGGKTTEYQEPWVDGKKPRFYKNDNRQTTRTDVHTLYHANWVIDMDESYMYEYGRPQNLPYNYETKEVEFPIHFYKMKGKSFVRQMRPLANDIAFTYFKLQNAIIQAPPPGLAIDIGTLENLTLDGSTPFVAKDAIRLYSQKGHMIYRLAPSTMQLPNSRNRPVEELRGGLGTAITDALAALELFYQQLDIITGLDSITTGTQAPKPDQGKAVTEMAVASTGNTLKPMYSGYLTIKEAQTRTATYFIQALSYLYRDDLTQNPYFKVIGKTNLLAIITAGEYPPVAYGFSSKAVPSDSMRNEVIGAARDAMKVGKNGVPGITPSEYLFLVEHLDSYDGIAWARVFLARKEQQHRKEDAEAGKAAQENNAIIAKSQQEAKDAGMQAKVKAELEAKKELAKIETDEAIRLDDAKTNNLIRLKKEVPDVRVEK